MNTPSIAVVVPLYNHARFIEATLRSVLDQTEPADEIALIDDGSTDGGLAVAERALEGVSQARVYRQENAGAHETINRLVAATRAEWIAVLNSDDLFRPGKLARVRALAREDVDAEGFFGRIELIDDDGAPLFRGETVEWLARAERFRLRCADLRLALMNENFLATTSNLVFRRAAWERLRGFQALRYCHDLDFALQLAAAGTLRMDADSAHIAYRVHRGNTIKERLDHVRLEIAAVLACALQDAPAAGADEDPARWAAMLAGKGLSNPLAYLAALRAASSREEVYARIADPAARRAILAAFPVT